MAFRESTARAGLKTQWDDLLLAQAGGDASIYALFKGIISQESAWNPSAENPADPSAGLMQILIGSRGPYPAMTREQILDPQTNIILGTNFLKSLLSRYSQSDAVAAYNAGMPKKNSAGQYTNSRGDTMVQSYVDAVLTYQTWFMNHLPGISGGASESIWGSSVETLPNESGDGNVQIDDQGNIIEPASDTAGLTIPDLAGGAGILIVAGVIVWLLSR